LLDPLSDGGIEVNRVSLRVIGGLATMREALEGFEIVARILDN
jgi:hypothetical protein